MSTMQSQPQRGGCLTIWIILVLIGGVFSIISYLTQSTLLQQTYPAATTGVILLLAAAGVLIAISGIGLWMWRKWGVYLYVAGAVVSVVGNFILGIGLAGIVGAVIGIGILWLLIRNKWTAFV